MLLLLPFLQFAAVDCLHIWVMKEREREREREREKTIPNTIFSFPGPLKTASVALYWSPNACLPMQMGFVQPTS
jgi:hypothetical protein